MVESRISTAANFWKKIPENRTGMVRDIEDLSQGWVIYRPPRFSRALSAQFGQKVPDARTVCFEPSLFRPFEKVKASFRLHPYLRLEATHSA
jgi:hypothetical protein